MGTVMMIFDELSSRLLATSRELWSTSSKPPAQSSPVRFNLDLIIMIIPFSDCFSSNFQQQFGCSNLSKIFWKSWYLLILFQMFKFWEIFWILWDKFNFGKNLNFSDQGSPLHGSNGQGAKGTNDEAKQVPKGPPARKKLDDFHLQYQDGGLTQTLVGCIHMYLFQQFSR